MSEKAKAFETIEGDLSVGQKLYFVSNVRYKKNAVVEIVKIGRKYAYLDNGDRIDDRLRVDGNGYNSPGKCYLSKRQYRAFVDLTDILKEFFDKVDVLRRQTTNPYAKPKVTPENVLEAAKILNIEIETKIHDDSESDQ